MQSTDQAIRLAPTIPPATPDKGVIGDSMIRCGILHGPAEMSALRLDDPEGTNANMENIGCGRDYRMALRLRDVIRVKSFVTGRDRRSRRHQ